MKVGRNQPCPCGSGRKYKQCCEALDHDVGLLFRVTAADVPGPTPAEVARAAGAEPWQADVIRGMGGTESPGSGAGGASAMTLVLGGGHVLCLEALQRAPEDADRTAALLERALRVAVRSAGVTPSELLVRTEDLAARLREGSSPAGAAVTASTELPELDLFAQGAVEQFNAGESQVPRTEVLRTQMHDTWREWGWPSGVVAELFRAAAEYWRAAPWRLLDTAQPLSLRLPSGSAWTACVLGNAGVEFGLALYSDPEDLRRQMEADDPDEGMAALHEPVLSLTYVRRDELVRPAVKEILARGWEVAGSSAYPELVALNPPPRGVSPEWAGELAGALRAVARFVDLHRALLEGEVEPDQPVRWVDPETAVELSYEGHAGEDVWPLWEIPLTLASALPAGPSADPEAALVEADPGQLHERAAIVVQRFRAQLEEEGLALAEIERCIRHVGWLIEGVAGYQAVPLAAFTELDLRLVLYDWLPRKSGAAESEGQEIPASLERFFAFLAEREGLVFPWAEPILRDREAFEIRLGSAPGGSWWDAQVADWRAEVYDDLDARVLLPDSEMAGGGLWGPTMGPVEAALNRELGRRWLLWRDEVIASGLREPEAVWEALVARQREWELAGHPRHGGQAPVEAIAEEREATVIRY
jgi:hypothetical protein